MSRWWKTNPSLTIQYQERRIKNCSAPEARYQILILYRFKKKDSLFRIHIGNLKKILGAGIVTTRAHVHYVVTEYGYTNLFGKNLRQRAYELIRIAHPDHREELEKAAFERLSCMPSP